MITQDSLRFYKNHAVYPQFGGVVLDREEGQRIAQHLGDGKAIILQNHGLLTVRIPSYSSSLTSAYHHSLSLPYKSLTCSCSSQVGQTIDAAAFWFLSLDKTCHAQLLVDAAAQGSGHKKTFIPEEEAGYSYQQVGTPEKGWLAFQPYYDDILAKTNGSFLK